MNTTATTTEKRRASIKKGRLSSNETNTLKGLISFVGRKTKKAELKNKLINELLLNGMYNDIYEKYMKYTDELKSDDEESDTDDNDDEILKYMTFQEFKLLSALNFCRPEELNNKREGFYIQEIPLNI